RSQGKYPFRSNFLAERVIILFIVSVCFVAKYLSANKKPAGFIVLWLLANNMSSQVKDFKLIELRFVFADQPLVLDSAYILINNNTIKFENLKCANSNGDIIKNKQPVW